MEYRLTIWNIILKENKNKKINIKIPDKKIFAMSCHVTAESKCQCTHKLKQFGNHYVRASLRKLFSDHAWYTQFLIAESLPVQQPNSQVVTERLLRNPDDIAAFLKHVVGAKKAAEVGALFKEHLMLAASALEPVRNGQTELVTAAVEKFYTQGDLVACGLHKLNPERLSANHAKKMMRQHNEFVVQLATLRQKQDYGHYVKTLDDYYAHMLCFSDMVYKTVRN